MPKGLDKFPSKLPSNYVTKTLQRLLPPVDVIRSLPAAKLRDLFKAKEELTQLITEDPVRFFQPSPGGQYDFLTTSDPSIQGLYFFAGNKAGKTTGAAILVSENAIGTPLWGRDNRAAGNLLLSGRQPIRICAFCEDFSTHEEVIVPTLLSWTPRSLLAVRPVEYGPSGNVTKILYRNGSIIYLRTYDQGYAKAEGKDYDLVWCDEPPPRDIYTAIFRGLVAEKGRLVIAATLLSETWLYDELSQPFVRAFEATMFDNPWLDSEARANFESLLSEEERAIRIYGKPTNLSGLIYQSFKDADPYVIPLADKIWNPYKEEPYPIILGVDPHERKPMYCLWGWLTPNNRLVWFRYELVPPGPLSEVFGRISEIEKQHTSPTRLVVMDPNRGRAKQIDNRSWEEEFQEHGYDVLLGIDDINFGHTELREMLATSSPQMVWMETCRGKGGPIYQMQHYTWDDYSRGTRYERDLKERPRQKHKDFPDIHRYVAAAHLDYRMLTNRNSLVIDLFAANGKERQNRNPYFARG